jgi:carboxyl-terminal processing protease
MKKHIFATLTTLSLLLAACGAETTPTSNSSSNSETPSSSSVETSDGSSSVSSSSETSSTTSSSSGPLTSQDRVQLDLASINYELGMALPKLGTNRSVISWRSSHPHVISQGGGHIEIPVGGQPVDVTLTATATHGGFSQEKNFSVIVSPIQAPTITRTRTVPFVNTSEEYVVQAQASVELHFTDTGTVPYMDVEAFMQMVDGAIDFSVLQFTETNNELLVSYRIEDIDDDNQPIFFDYEATLDFDANTLTVEDFSFFGSYVESTETNFSDGLVFLGGIGLNAIEVVIDLDDYRVDLIKKDGEHLIPLSVLNLFFLNAIYYDVYYNGDTLYGFDTFSALDGESTVLNDIKTSSFNTLTMEKDLRQSTYHFLALAFDYFYGLKPDKNIESFYDYLIPYADAILTGTDRSLYNGLFSFIYGLDDLHSWHQATGFYEPTSYELSLTALSQLGPNTQNYYQSSWAIEDIIEAVYGAGNLPPAVRLLDNETIAVLFLTGFNVDTPDEVKALLDALPTTVESVIVDLSFNGGGNVGAVLRLFGYITENQIEFSSMNPNDGSAATYVYESTYDAFDYNWYVMTSSVTFSAANLMASMAQEMDVATIIGTQSSGGAASIGMFITPDGTILFRSTNNVFATVDVDAEENRTYTSVESGVVVDYVLTNTFDDAAIVALLNQIESQA